MRSDIIEKREVRQVQTPRLCDASPIIHGRINEIWDDLTAEERKAWASSMYSGYLINKGCTRYTIKRGKMYVKRYVRKGLDSIVDKFNIEL